MGVYGYTMHPDDDDMLAGELPKQLQNVVRSRQSMQESHRLHSGKTIVDQRTKAEQLAQANEFFADKSSKWARIVRMSERVASHGVR